MDEFYDLFLTGKQAHNLIKFRRAVRIFAAVGAVIMLVPVFVVALRGGEHAALNAAFSVVGLVFECASVFLSCALAIFGKDLVEVQNLANRSELRGEERALFQRLYLAWKETVSKRDIRRSIAIVCRVLAYTVLAVSVVITSYLTIPPYIFAVTCLASAVLLIASAVTETVSGLRLRAALYERAEADIDEIKRSRLGYDAERLAKDAEIAHGMSSVPVPVRLFLKEETERRDFCAVARKSVRAGGLFAFALGLTCLLAFLLGAGIEKIADVMPEVMLLLLLVFSVIYFAVIFPLERRKREIFQRNENKLGEGETDALRRALQGAWLHLQRTGNIMFACFLAAAVTAGLVLGIIGSALSGADPLASIGGWIMVILVPAAIVSLIVWSVMYAVYRKRVRPTEICLRERIRGERG